MPQSAFSYGEKNEQTTRKSKSKKRHGKYQLWMRGKHAMLISQWHKIRSYETMELAEQNLQMCDRKWNAFGDSWEFEIRIEDDK